MGDVPFHLTGMGKRFFEGTLPALVEAIERLNENLERLAGTADETKESPRAEDAPGEGRGPGSVS